MTRCKIIRDQDFAIMCVAVFFGDAPPDTQWYEVKNFTDNAAWYNLTVTKMLLLGTVMAARARISKGDYPVLDFLGSPWA